MQANVTHYEDITQVEDDILSFLPTVSDIDVFVCEVELAPVRSLSFCAVTTEEAANHSSALPGRGTLHLAIPSR